MEFDVRQMREEALLPEGIYAFKVMDAVEKTSSRGNQMINLRLRLFMPDGRETLYWDSLFLMPKMFWKIEHFCQATGLENALEKGKLTPQDCIGREGEIHLIRKQNVQTGETENFTKDYVRQVKVEMADVSVPDMSAPPLPNVETDPKFNDDVPF